ncbi:MAG: protein-L-isoaspartate(D-aspartate) O-methyltransferase [Gammaproteobacteria bacterium]|nr:protein-L-isoaspartate(D-aspartate) O-methyltransferase [Gammaproteobacteria bacterium]
MVDEIRDMARVTGFETGRELFTSPVMAAMEMVPRHGFVPRESIGHAYENRPLGIGHGQTISQPYIVALMTDLLGVGRESVVLEIGTGSGYQAAVLAELVKKVYTVEIIEPLAVQAKSRLARLGYKNVVTRLGDGYYGWKKHAPFDAVIVTAAADHVPPPLVLQLKPGGRMIIPVGGRFLVQYLLLIEKDLKGSVSSRQILPVRFVPLTGDH